MIRYRQYFEYFLEFLVIVFLSPVGILFVCFDKLIRCKDMGWAKYMYNDSFENFEKKEYKEK